MKTYPSIDFTFDPKSIYHYFDKLDGSNIRAEWAPKQGFNKFGSRTQLLTESQEKLFPAIEAFKNKYASALQTRLEKIKVERAIVFFEWYGPNSFAGSHPDPVSEMTSTVIDVGLFKRGILPPEQFLSLMDGLETPKLLGVHRVSDEFRRSVWDSELAGMTFEGVIGKGPFSQKSGGPVMFKLKSNAWRDKLKEMCNGDEALYNRLR